MAARPTLEDVLCFLADRCDSALTSDGRGFNKDDTDFGKAMAEKVRSGQRLTQQEYNDIHKMLEDPYKPTQ